MRRILSAALTALATMLVTAPGDAQSRRGAELFGNPPVVNQDGQALKFYDDLIKDKVVVVVMLSMVNISTCEICPLMMARTQMLEEKLGAAVGRNIFIITLTTDPENDTPAILKEYSERFGTGPGWTLVTGKPEDIRTLNNRLGWRSERRSEIMLGNDATGEWRRIDVMDDTDLVADTVHEMMGGPKVIQKKGNDHKR